MKCTTKNTKYTIMGLGMNGSDKGENSYANNSIIQRTVISKTQPMVEHAIKAMAMELDKSFPEQCFAVADLGCSSGPNTLLFLSNFIHVIASLSGPSPPQLQVFLNDLPTNDFNSVFMSLPGFHRRLGATASVSCYVSATPGSFYERLFPDSTLHFVHSSYSGHWLSQVPRGIENNKGHIYIGSTSPPNISQAYEEQFRADFSSFLNHRAKELKPGGRILLAFIGRRDDDRMSRDSGLLMELLSKSLLDMVAEGSIEAGAVDSFNLPKYFPSKGQVMEIVERERSFRVDEIRGFEVNWDGSDKESAEVEVDTQRSGQKVASIIRAVCESLLVTYFGDGVIEDLFIKYAKHIADCLSIKNTYNFNIVISMTKM